ncbi:MAG TPA: cytochrome c3 family protein [bacterium]|nr:cytochrome c3 family protein [bacterium]
MRSSHPNALIRRPVLLLAAAGVLLVPAGVYPEPQGEGTEPPLRETAVCLDCHDDQGASLSLSPHRVNADSEGPEALVTCTDCHQGDSRHWDEDPEEFPMSNPGTLGAVTEAQQCATCHQNSHQQTAHEQNVHFANDVSCSGCHQVHGSSEAGLLRAPEVDLCLSCHTSVEGQFAQPFHHPVHEGIVKCSECHLTLDETSRELSRNGTNAACVKCHAEFGGPFPFEHQATLDYSTEEGGCLSCHAAHGSSQPRMLTQPYESPHFQLCTQCHMVPPGHNQNSFHGSMWAGIACNECHSDVHGSYTSRNLLSPSLQGLGCNTAGCHK